MQSCFIYSELKRQKHHIVFFNFLLNLNLHINIFYFLLCIPFLTGYMLLLLQLNSELMNFFLICLNFIQLLKCCWSAFLMHWWCKHNNSNPEKSAKRFKFCVPIQNCLFLTLRLNEFLSLIFDTDSLEVNGTSLEKKGMDRHTFKIFGIVRRK